MINTLNEGTFSNFQEYLGMTASDHSQIAEYLAVRGVTKCPTVCLAKTTAIINKEDKRLLKRHQEKQNEILDAKIKRLFYQRVCFLLGLMFIPIVSYLS